MRTYLASLIVVMLIASGCSLIFEAAPADDGPCTGCTDLLGACVSPPIAENCGLPGGTCSPCDLFRADTCTSGNCLCGDGPPCTGERRCIDGECRCTDDFCTTGCCSDSEVCRTGSTLLSCGEAGADCESCDPGRANGCAEGQCQCGAGPACDPGLRCDGNDCVCDGTSCPDGCCDGDTCVESTDQSNQKCGIGGNACVDCGANACADGVCEGCQEACAGLGCCSGNCIPVSPDNPNACNGIDGNTCTACGIGADGCDDLGQCTCNGGPACAAGQACSDSGLCVCDASSCPTGCCKGADCVAPPNASSCGIEGKECVSCGSGFGCDTDIGECVCDSGTCPNGCCDAANGCVEVGQAGNDCDTTGGGTCVTCPLSQTCNLMTQTCQDIATGDGGPVVGLEDGGPVAAATGS